MHEGLDRDDIYIMVEDEFQAVAKQFTQHLHHAEYVRLKNLAKTRNESTIITISRPTDSITAMREETKRRKDHEAKAAKQKSALAQLKAEAAAKRPKTGSEEESDADVTKDDTPWAGTTLQGLMTSPSTSRQQMSLTGLQGVMSSTRAAAGFTKPDARRTELKTFDISPDVAAKDPPLRNPATTLHSAVATEAEDDATASDEDDDLDAPVKQVRHTRRTSYNTITTIKPTAQRSTTIAAQKQPLLSPPTPPPSRTALQRPTHNSTKANGGSQRAKAVSSSEIPDSFTLPRSDVSARIMKRRANMNARQEKGSEPAAELDEIPIFLV